MIPYEEQYYFIRKPKNSPFLPELQADMNTSKRHFRFEAQKPSSAPLIFHNSWKQQNLNEGIKAVVPNILFDGANVAVRTPIYDKLIHLLPGRDIPNLSMHHAIYINDDDQWHEDFWYLTFTDRFDCWDRNTSDYDQDDPPIQLGGMSYFQVYHYKFNKELMDKTPLEDRLLFEMGGTLDAFVVCHSSILKVFGPIDKSGAEFQRVDQY